MSYRIRKGLLLLTVAGLGWSIVHAQTKTPAKPQRLPEGALMRAKVASSHKIMDGLVAKNFPEIRGGAEELGQICRGTEWQAHSDPVYAHHRSELIRQSNKLIDSADQANLDAATFAYINALTTCINCHDHCRDVLKIADVKPTAKIIQIPTTDSDDVPTGKKVERR
ncbi:MAG: hypothetical protein ACKV0T_04900 [Planctomycetales bacterium]